ncbi:restriction endonuclease subunit S [Methanobrevibacter sp.]|uniref:restriction endonuclease subunit S n=1 Tax=Methanobrevibacter sp. TaxID=66852 RepID=UPI003D7E1D07
MSLEWKTVELKSITNITMGQSPKSEFYNDSFEGMPFLQGNKTFGDKYPSFELYTTSTKKVAKESSVLMSVRAPVGDLNIAKEDICIGRGVCGIQMKEGNNEFLYYLLKANISHLINKESGTVFGSINKKDIETFEITLPKDFKDQMKILNILKNIDKKIEVCKDLNKNLEQLSQNLFRKWFIDFDLKNDFNMSEPFKESNLGEIPESWEIKTIGDLSDVKGRIGWRGYTTNDLVDEGPWVVGGKEITSGFIDFNSAKHLTREKYDESPEIMLRDKDLIIAKTGTIGPIAMYYEIYGEATLNPNVGLIRSKNIAPALLLTFFKTPRAQYYLNEFTTSSVQPAINQTTIKQLEVALPSDKQLLNKIGAKFEEINLLQFNLNEVTKKLQRLRDTLLPKLMSGEIDVSKINCDLIITSHYLSARFPVIQHLFIKSYNLTSRLSDTAINV